MEEKLYNITSWQKMYPIVWYLNRQEVASNGTEEKNQNPINCIINITVMVVLSALDNITKWPGIILYYTLFQYYLPPYFWKKNLLVCLPLIKRPKYQKSNSKCYRTKQHCWFLNFTSFQSWLLKYLFKKLHFITA